MGVTQRKGVKAGDGKKSTSPKAKKVVASPPTRKLTPKAKAPAAPKAHTRGRRFEPTPQDRQQVMLMAAMGWTHEQMGRQVRFADGGIGVKTLTKYFAEELETGLDRCNMAVAGNLFRIATGNDKAAHITGMFWMKARAGWIDKPERIAIAEVEGAQNIAGLPPPENGKIVIRLKMEG